MYFIGGVASGYGGYLLNVCYQPGKDINYFLNRLDQVMAAPFANYWNETSLKAIILGIFVYVIGMVMYVTSRKKLYARSGIWYRCFCRSEKGGKAVCG